MKRIFYITLLLLAVAPLAGCSDWLDVQSSGEMEEGSMFEGEQGYLNALTGSYLLLGSLSAYGRELTVGFPEEIVHNWEKNSEFYNHRYTDSDMADRLDATWLKMYEAIANTNLLLEHLKDENPAAFKYYNLIKGEALALRAYVHLDLLRLYGPVLKNGLDQLSIPYRETFSNKPVARMTARTVLGRIEADLLAAYDLMKNDPINTYGRKLATTATDPKVYDLSFEYRGMRLNYYAVCAALARLYMLRGEPATAVAYAREVIDAKAGGKPLFRLLDRATDIVGVTTINLMFETELVWSLYEHHIGSAGHIADALIQQYSANEAYKAWAYNDCSGNPNEYRALHLWKKTATTPAVYYLAKYQRTMDSNDRSKDVTAWQKMIPMIRLTEMYYIIAQANIGVDNATALGMSNTVRTSRNLDPLNNPSPTDDFLRQELAYEYRKDTWGEGKLFYFYKHTYSDIKTYTENVPASAALYELPIPQDEIVNAGK